MYVISSCGWGLLTFSEAVCIMEQGEMGTYNAADISGGLEAVPVSVCNEESPGMLPQRFLYSKVNVVYNNALLIPLFPTSNYPNMVPAAYTKSGTLHPWLLRLLESKTNSWFIKECWGVCDCYGPCVNRVVQKGMTLKCDVVWIGPKKGWGVRTLEDLSEGAFVFEFIGEVLTNTEMEIRVSCSLLRCKSPAILNMLLDADLDLDEKLDDSEALCLDATYMGNVARFVNHQCGDANLIHVPVLIESEARQYYHVSSRLLLCELCC